MPIKNWYDDRTDRELYNLTQILEFLAYVPDVRDYIKKMTEKNEISYVKSMNIINSYHLNAQNEHYKNLSNSNIHSMQSAQSMQSTQGIQSPNNLQNSQGASLQNKNKNIKDYIYKSVNQGSMAPHGNNLEDERDKENQQNSKYSSNLIMRGGKSQTPTPSNNYLSGSGNYTPSHNSINSSNTSNLKKDQSQNSLNSQNPADKQNINIVLINNHINRYIVNPQEAALNAKNNQNNPNNPNQQQNSGVSHLNSMQNSQIGFNPHPHPQSNENIKKHKSINTFRSSNSNNPNNIYTLNQTDLLTRSNNANPMNRSNNGINSDGSNLGYINTGLNMNHNNKFNIKSLNSGSSNSGEIKSPILKNNSSINNSKIIANSHINNNISKYSSLLGESGQRGHHVPSTAHQIHHGQINQISHQMSNHPYQNFSSHPNSSRPSSAITIKGRHARDMSNNSAKNDHIHMNAYLPINRSPSSQNMPQPGLNRNYSKTSLNSKRDTNTTPRNNYLLSLDKSLTPSGNKTVRPSSTNDRLRINYSSNLNPLSSMNNLNNIKVANRYDVEDLINRRGYSLSSRANDLKPSSYRYEESKVRYQTPSKYIYLKFLNL